MLLTAGQVTASGKPAEVLTQAFGTGVQVLKTADGDLAVISHRRRRDATPADRT